MNQFLAQARYLRTQTQRLSVVSHEGRKRVPTLALHYTAKELSSPGRPGNDKSKILDF